MPVGGSSSAASEARKVAPPSPVVKARRWPLAERAVLRLSKHDVAAAVASASPDRAPAAVAPPRRRGGPGPGDFCNVRRMQQSCAADDAAGARPLRQSTSGPVARLLPNLVAEARPSAQAGTVAAGAFSWTDTLAGARGANCCICSESAGSMPSVATCVPRRRWHPAMQHGLRCRFSSSAGRVCSGNGSGGDAASVRASPGR